MDRCSSVGVATGYGLDGPGIESRWGAKFTAPVQTGPGAHPASCTMGTGSFPEVKSCRGVTLTPHSLLIPWSWKGRAIPLLPYGPYGLYRASEPVQGWSLPLPTYFEPPEFILSETGVCAVWYILHVSVWAVWRIGECVWDNCLPENELRSFETCRRHQKWNINL